MLKKNNPYLLLTLLLAFAYLPLLSFFMGIKNDALVVTYPVFYFFSNQLSRGHIPWWHYNLHMGFPLHADPGTPFWNPIFWSFALTGKNIFVFTWLIWTHVLIAAYGFFRLGKWLGFTNKLNIVLSLSYACSGFFVCHIQHTNNLFEAAFLPFVLVYFLQLVYQPSTKYAVLLAISLFFLVNSGYPGFPISAIYFLVLLLLLVLFNNPSTYSTGYLKKIFSYLLLAIVLAVLFSLPYLVSLTDIANNFSRASPFAINGAFIENGGITSRSLLSLFFPLATAIHPEFYQTDISWNNLYFGIVLLPFFIYAACQVKNKFVLPLLFAGLFLLLLSFQGTVKAFLFHHLPLLNLVRSNGEFRIYFILTALLISGFGVEQALQAENVFALKKIIKVVIALLFTSFLLAVFFSFRPNTSSIISSTTGIYALLKNTSIPAAIALQSITGMALLLFALLYIRQKRTLYLLVTVDIIFSFWINLPYTGLGRDNAVFINHSIQTSIQQINALPDSATIKEVSSPSFKTKFIAHPALYANKEGILTETAYPSAFSSYIHLLRSDSILLIQNNGIVSFAGADHSSKKISPVVINSHQIYFTVAAAINDSIFIAQNYHPNWHCTVDGKEVAIQKAFNTFMRIPVTAGSHNIVLTYSPVKEIIAWWISLSVWTIAAFVLYRNRTKQPV